eukprot:CAMPEP_0168469742 /NCGR_PEP_ID=MMETSP0228-20121227/58375_1 /TAXON_ID=133427 /ORGANISM="Protoceratium reticulatum, Strain CCCM 535 (=CCMP 1889)" /LENGTH=127 /DNA_ID=CAMNT_0008485533 /DNA_START=126 /DNA_END=506 /DNA_ORIENTATION=+
MAHLGGSRQELVTLLEAMFTGATDHGDDEILDIRLLAPSPLVGGIIGRGGSNVAAIRQASGAQVQIERTPPGSQDEFRAIELSGSCPQLRLALVQMVVRIYEEHATSGGSPSPGFHSRREYDRDREH